MDKISPGGRQMLGWSRPPSIIAAGALSVACTVSVASAFNATSRASGTSQALASAPAEALLARAADYVLRFERSMAAVVLEERYVQVIKRRGLPPKEPDLAHLAWHDDLSKIPPDVIVFQRRQTKSDLLLVQVANQKWAAFRDTFEVNGRQQRHREDRLRKLFLEGTEDSQRQLRRIHQASADWNLGRFYREVNLPTTGLLVLHPRFQQRFAFRAGAVEDTGEVACRRLGFKETTKPTLVRSEMQRDVPLTGHVCVDETGVVRSTWLDLDERYTARGVIEVTYGRHEKVDVLVPARMWEWYFPRSPVGIIEAVPSYIEAWAEYSNLRRFTVSTEEQVK